jgi:hypothetical protein
MKPNSSRLPRACRAVTMTMADTPHIEGRLRALLNDRSPRHVVRGAVLGAIAGAVVLSIPLAALRPAPAQAPPPPNTVTQEQLAQIEAQLKRIEEQLSRLKATSDNAAPRADADRQRQVELARQAVMQAEEARKVMEMQLRDRAMMERQLVEVELQKLQAERRMIEIEQQKVEERVKAQGIGGTAKPSIDPRILALRDAGRNIDLRISVTEERLKDALRRAAEQHVIAETERAKP